MLSEVESQIRFLAWSSIRDLGHGLCVGLDVLDTMSWRACLELPARAVLSDIGSACSCPSHCNGRGPAGLAVCGLGSWYCKASWKGGAFRLGCRFPGSFPWHVFHGEDIPVIPAANWKWSHQGRGIPTAWGILSSWVYGRIGFTLSLNKLSLWQYVPLCTAKSW